MLHTPTTADAWLLFGHVIAVVILTAGIGLEVYAVTAAGRATTVAELRLAVRAARTLPILMPLATLLMTGCGLALVAHDPAYHFGDAWVIAAIGIVVAISIVGGGFSGRPTTRLLDATEATPEGPLPPHLTALARDPLLQATTRITAIAATWAIWLMSVRPHAAGTLASLAAATLLSAAAAASTTPPAAGVGSDVGGGAPTLGGGAPRHLGGGTTPLGGASPALGAGAAALGGGAAAGGAAAGLANRTTGAGSTARGDGAPLLGAAATLGGGAPAGLSYGTGGAGSLTRGNEVPVLGGAAAIGGRATAGDAVAGFGNNTCGGVSALGVGGATLGGSAAASSRGAAPVGPTDPAGGSITSGELGGASGGRLGGATDGGGSTVPTSRETPDRLDTTATDGAATADAAAAGGGSAVELGDPADDSAAEHDETTKRPTTGAA